MTQKHLKIIHIEFDFNKSPDRYYYNKRRKKALYDRWPFRRQVSIPWDETWDRKGEDQTCYRLSEIAGVPVKVVHFKEL